MWNNPIFLICASYILQLALTEEENVLSIYYDNEIYDDGLIQFFNDDSLWDSVENLFISSNKQRVKKKCLKGFIKSDTYCLCQLEGLIKQYECNTGAAHIVNNDYYYYNYNNHYDAQDYYMNEMVGVDITVIPLRRNGGDGNHQRTIHIDDGQTVAQFKTAIWNEDNAEFHNRAKPPDQQNLIRVIANPDFDHHQAESSQNPRLKGEWIKETRESDLDRDVQVDNTVQHLGLGGQTIYIAGTRASIDHHIYNNALTNTLQRIKNDVNMEIDRKYSDQQVKNAKKKIWRDFQNSFQYNVGLGVQSFQTCLNHFVFNVGRIEGGINARDGLVVIPNTRTMANGGVSRENLDYLLADDNKEGFTALQNALYLGIGMYIGNADRTENDYTILRNKVYDVWNARDQVIDFARYAARLGTDHRWYRLTEWCDGPVARYMVEEIWNIGRTTAAINDQMVNHAGGDTTHGEKEFYYLSKFGSHIRYKFGRIPRILKRIFPTTDNLF